MTTNRADSAADTESSRRQKAEQRRDDAWESLQRSTRANRTESERIKALNRRLCPNCRTALEPHTVRGVEVDQCSSCHGTWLDEGELEQLTQRGPGLVARLLAPFRGKPESKNSLTK